MKKEYYHWYSPSLEKDMEINVYGHAGRPLLVFPAQGGTFYEFEDFHMIDAIGDYIESGRIMVFTVGSVDYESWLNESLSFADRVNRHNAYDAYNFLEVVPFIHNMANRGDIITTGCSFGAYHAMNFFLRHPDAVNGVISLSGLYQLSYFLGDYVDENVYFNYPLLYLPNCSDPWYLDKYRSSQIIACCGRGAWENEMIADLTELDRVFREKNIPAWCDFWGCDVNHDWPWWRKQLPYFLGHIV